MNGLAFSPDERTMYVNDTGRRHIRAFEVLPNGILAKQTDRVFADLSGSDPGVPDGMKVDTAGNVYCGGSGGLYILDSQGKKLGRIVHGERTTTNIAFGGDDWKTLYFTSFFTLFSVKLKMPESQSRCRNRRRPEKRHAAQQNTPLFDDLVSELLKVEEARTRAGHPCKQAAVKGRQRPAAPAFAAASTPART
jgi:SMP-30/Gluconolactonase/LRE-like region